MITSGADPGLRECFEFLASSRLLARQARAIWLSGGFFEIEDFLKLKIFEIEDFWKLKIFGN